MNRELGRLSLSLVLFLLVAAPDVMAEPLEQASVSESPWAFELFIDGWLPKAPVTITHEDIEVGGPESLKAILDSMKFSMMLRFRAHKGPLGFFVDPLYYKGTYDESEVIHDGTGKRKAILRESVWKIDYGVSYEAGRWDIGKEGNSRVVTLEPYAGFRWVHDNIEVEVESTEIHEEFARYFTINTNSPLVGLRSQMQLKDAWGLMAAGDYGGFGVGDMDKAYKLEGFVDYKFNWKKFKSRAYFGYRYLHLNYENDTTAIKVNIKGPVLGISFIF